MKAGLVALVPMAGQEALEVLPEQTGQFEARARLASERLEAVSVVAQDRWRGQQSAGSERT